MELIARPLLRFAAFASGGLVVAIVACTLIGADRLIMATAAVLMAPAAWLSGLRRWPGVGAAILVSAALYLALLILPLYILLGGTYTPVLVRQIGELAATMAAWCALPVLAGCALTRYRPFNGVRP